MPKILDAKPRIYTIDGMKADSNKDMRVNINGIIMKLILYFLEPGLARNQSRTTARIGYITTAKLKAIFMAYKNRTTVIIIELEGKESNTLS